MSIGKKPERPPVRIVRDGDVSADGRTSLWRRIYRFFVPINPAKCRHRYGSLTVSNGESVRTEWRRCGRCGIYQVAYHWTYQTPDPIPHHQV